MDEARITVRRSQLRHVVRISGVLDYTASVRLRLVLFDQLDAGAHTVVLDLSQVPLMDASSVDVLLRVREDARHRGAEVYIQGARGLVLEVLEITGTAKDMVTEFDLEDGAGGPAPAVPGRGGDAGAPGAAPAVTGPPSPWGDEVGGLVRRLAGLPVVSPERAELRRRAVESCLPYTERLAHRFLGLGEAAADLNQVAVLGLLKAIDGYDPSLNTDFGAYALPTVIGELKRYFRDKGWGVRVPRRLQELRLEINGVRDELTQRLRRSPTVVDIAAHLAVSEDDVIQAMVAATGYRPASLYAPVGDEDFAPVDRLGDNDPEYDAIELRASVHPLLARLPQRLRQIIAMRFYGNMTQSDIAARLGISQMHVSRLLRHALDRLRQGLLDNGGQT